MPTQISRPQLEIHYFHAAQDYLHNLPLEHFMEATPQGTQRAITLASFAVVSADWPEFQTFNELLVQYPVRGQRRPGQVVPDNMVVIHAEPIQADGSFDVPLQPARPFLVLEYVSKSSKRKDYDDNMAKYERQLKVPYYLRFYPEIQDLNLFRHNGRKFVSVKPNEQGRYPIPELKLEAGLLDNWVRYWYKGKLIPLPGELQHELNETRRQLDDKSRQLDTANQARQAAEDEVSRLRAELEQLKQRRNNHK